MTDIYAVTGNPILHSLSPAMQNAAFRACHLDSVYTRLCAESAEEALETARKIGMTGLNVTAPFKEEMARGMDTLDSDARRIGAVNTVRIDGRRMHGFNTDVYGVQAALEKNGVAINDKNAVVIGAGGAARAAVLALLQVGTRVTIANRTTRKARAIAKEFGCNHSSLDQRELRSILAGTDILVSAAGTSAAILPANRLPKNAVVLDAYYATESMLVRDARKRGCRIIDGREWLLYQGAKAFEIFTGKKAPVAAMRKALYVVRKAHFIRRKTSNPLTPTSKSIAQIQHIALIGFMGSGKTTVGKVLAQKTKRTCMDLDSYIEKNEGTSISEIFENRGPPHFRKLERRALHRALQRAGRVVACGGGAILSPSSRNLLRQRSTVVWLWATPRAIFRRIAHDHSRPLLNVKNREGIAHQIIQNRLRLYVETSDMIVNTEKRNPTEVARVIANEIQREIL